MINLQFDFKQANEEEKALLLKSVDNPSEIERFATTYEKGILFGKTRVIFAGRVYKDNYRLLGFVIVNKNSEEFDFEREFWLSLVNSKTRIPLEEKKPVPISDSSGHCKPEDGYEYYVIRKAKGDRFEESSFAKVVSADELILINESQAVYKDELVFIQNFGDKEKCEKIKNGCNYELRHFGIGKEW